MHMRLDRGVARGELGLTGVKELKVLLQDEEMLGPIVTGQGGDDLGLGRAAPMIAMLGELVRVAVTGHDVAEDPQSGHTGDVADDQWPLQVHLHERFLHALNVGPRTFDERLAMTEIGAEGDDGIGRPKTPAQEAHAVQLADPLTIRDIAFSPGHVLEVPRVHQQHLESAGLQDLVHRDPVDAGRFHRHAPYATGAEPVCQAQQIAREGRKRSHRRRVAIGRHGDKMFRRAAIDPCDVRIETLEDGGRDAWLSWRPAAIVFHRKLLHTAPSIREQGGGTEDILPNGITGV